MPLVRDTYTRHARTDLTLARLTTPVTGLCLLLLFLTSFVNDRQLGYPFESIASNRIASMPSLESASNGHAAGAPVALGALLEESKRDFLAALKAQQRLDDWIIVMGNEAGDLDSVASAVGYAYFSQTLVDPSSSKRYLPLYHADSADLLLRPENSFAFEASSIDPRAHVLFMDELPKQLGSLAADTGARYALVDHNRLGPAFGHDDASVVAVIDHHEDERVHLAAKPREIKVPTGSCSSLIAVHFLRGKTHAVVPRELADFLLSALVLDTNNVKPAPEGKARPDDLDAVKLLLPFSSLAQQPKRQKGVAAVSTTGQESLEDRTATLKAKKYDLSKLQGRDLLRRDYKEYESDKLHIRYGLATVPLQLREWLARPEIGGTWGPILEKMDEWAEERRLGIVGVLTSYKEGRELLFLLRGEGAELARLRQVFDELEKDETNGVLKLGALELGQPEYATKEESRKWDGIVFSYQQRNAAATRKQVAPAMKKAIEAVEAASS